MNTKQIYYVIHSVSFGDTLAATPTLRYLSQSHQTKINVVTKNKQVFKGNPYVNKLLGFDELEQINNSNRQDDVITYESFTYAGLKDKNGIEKKFAHIDIRQTHAMDLGFQLTPEQMDYDYYPDPMELDCDLPDEYVVLHITNNWANRTWDYQKWYDLIQWLADKNIFTVLIGVGHREVLHSSVSDVPLEKQCPHFDNVYGLDLANKGSMSDMWHVINKAKCIVTMDTGPLHIAGTTDTHIIQLGSAIHPALRAPYRNGSQNYKYDYIGGSCSLFCNSNLLYNVKEWGNINAVPPLNGCLEGYDEMKCHPSTNDVIKVLQNIIPRTVEDWKDIMWIHDDNELIKFNFLDTIEGSVTFVARDVATGLIRDTLTKECNKSNGYYWWDPNPGRVPYKLGSVLLEIHYNDEFIGKCILDRGKSEYNLEINGINVDYSDVNRKLHAVYYEIFTRGDYSSDIFDVHEDDVILDVGANFGFFTLYAIKKGASKIYSVEPHPDAYDKLKSLSNQFSSIVPIHGAITSDGNDVVNLYAPENNVSWAMLIDEKNEESIEVQGLNINDLIEKMNPIPNVLKVDIEGSEIQLFESITDENLNKFDRIAVETHCNTSYKTVVDRLNSVGFTVDGDKKVDLKNNIIYARRNV